MCACVCVCTWQTGGSGWFGSGQSGCKLGLGKKWVILSGLKMGSSQSGCGLSRVDHFSHIYIYFKENNMYLQFGKSCNKLLDIKCITLNSPLLSRTNFDNSLILHMYIIMRKYYHTYFELIHAFYSWFWNNAE